MKAELSPFVMLTGSILVNGKIIQYDGAKPHRVEPLVYDAGYRPARYSFVIYKIDKTKRRRKA